VALCGIASILLQRQKICQVAGYMELHVEYLLVPTRQHRVRRGKCLRLAHGASATGSAQTSVFLHRLACRDVRSGTLSLFSSYGLHLDPSRSASPKSVYACRSEHNTSVSSIDEQLAFSDIRKDRSTFESRPNLPGDELGVRRVLSGSSGCS
jgi:hypothetical protein